MERIRNAVDLTICFSSNKRSKFYLGIGGISDAWLCECLWKLDSEIEVAQIMLLLEN